MRPTTPKMSADEVPVLIVGAGPAGLTAAIELARRGVESLLVERRRVQSTEPRATAISTRSMELLRAWGLDEEIRAGGIEVEWLGLICQTLALASEGSPMLTGLPTSQQSQVISPTAPACVPQNHLEPVLLSHLRSLGKGRVELGSELVSLEAETGGVEATLRNAETGGSRTVRARYLIAADGQRSRVRAELGISMEEPDRLRPRVAAHFRAPLWELLGEHRYGIYPITHPEATGFFLPTGPDDRWIYGLEWDPEREQLTKFTEERMTRLIRLASGVATLQPRIERIDAVSYAAHLAERFRSGNAFLVGDAAHRVTPRGGTGMNTAIHDGYDLAWKLAWVLRGWAGPKLLDSYEAERRPVAQHNAARSADRNGLDREVTQELHVDLGGRIQHLWVPSAAGRVSTLDLLGSGLTLFSGPEGAAWKHAATTVPGPVPVAVESLDAIPARALGIRGEGALLARPDGSPIAWWPDGTDAGPALRAAVGSATAARGNRERIGVDTRTRSHLNSPTNPHRRAREGAVRGKSGDRP